MSVKILKYSKTKGALNSVYKVSTQKIEEQNYFGLSSFKKILANLKNI